MNTADVPTALREWMSGEFMINIYYQVKCFYITKEPDHFHCFDIGIFDSAEKAQLAVEKVKDKPGFCDHKDKIRIRKRIRFFVPKLLNRIFWEDGFVTYRY